MICYLFLENAGRLRYYCYVLDLRKIYWRDLIIMKWKKQNLMFILHGRFTNLVMSFMMAILNKLLYKQLFWQGIVRIYNMVTLSHQHAPLSYEYLYLMGIVINILWVSIVSIIATLHALIFGRGKWTHSLEERRPFTPAKILVHDNREDLVVTWHHFKHTFWSIKKQIWKKGTCIEYQ